jgi:hypothetical protein
MVGTKHSQEDPLNSPGGGRKGGSLSESCSPDLNPPSNPTLNSNTSDVIMDDDTDSNLKPYSTSDLQLEYLEDSFQLVCMYVCMYYFSLS